jgi:hypothetical protein
MHWQPFPPFSSKQTGLLQMYARTQAQKHSHHNFHLSVNCTSNAPALKQEVCTPSSCRHAHTHTHTHTHRVGQSHIYTVLFAGISSNIRRTSTVLVDPTHTHTHIHTQTHAQGIHTLTSVALAVAPSSPWPSYDTSNTLSSSRRAASFICVTLFVQRVCV